MLLLDSNKESNGCSLAFIGLNTENKGMRQYWKQVLVGAIIAVYLLFLYSPLLLLQRQAPAGTVNMMVGHYYEDYYEYLSFVKQGQQRQWYLRNLFTTDDPTRFWIPWWPYLIIGWLSFGADTISTYWWAAAIVTAGYLLLLFLTIRTLLRTKPFLLHVGTFLLLLCSSSLYAIRDGTVVVSGFWGALGSPFSRFSIGTPHHQVTNIVLLLVLLILGRQLRRFRLGIISLVMVLSSLALFVLSWAQMLLLWGGYAAVTLAVFPWGSVRRYTIEQWIVRWVPLLLAFLCMLPCTFLLKQSVAASPTLSIAPVWDLQNIYYPSLLQYAAGTGLLFFLAPLGLLSFIKTKDPLRLLLLGVSIMSLIFTLVPLRWGSFDLLRILSMHNFRFSTTLILLVAAVSTVDVLLYRVKRMRFIYLGIGILILFFLPALSRYWQVQADAAPTWDIIFMPKQAYTMMKALDRPGERGVVLTSPSLAYGLVIPALTGRSVFFGRSIFTLDIERKRKESELFYAGAFDQQQAREFLQRNGMTHVVLTHVDPKARVMQEQYPFLTVEEEYEMGTLMKVY